MNRNLKRSIKNPTVTISIGMRLDRQQYFDGWVETTGFYTSRSEFARAAIMMKIRRTFLAWARISPGVSVLKDIAEVSLNLTAVEQIEQYALPITQFIKQVRRQVIAEQNMSKVVYLGLPEQLVRFKHVRVI